MATLYQKTMDAAIKRYTTVHKGLNRLVVEHAVQQLTDGGGSLDDASIAAAYIQFLAYMDGMERGAGSRHATPSGAEINREMTRIEHHARIAGARLTRIDLNNAMAEFIEGWRTSFDDK